MPLYNKIQMKTRRGLEWEYLYPKTTIEQVIGYTSFNKIQNTVRNQSIEAGMNSTLNFVEGKGIKIEMDNISKSITISSNIDNDSLESLNCIIWDDPDIDETVDFIMLTEDYFLMTTESRRFIRIDTNFVTTEALDELLSENSEFVIQEDIIV